jgi:Transcriptional regulatory protein, C terminal
LSSDVRNPPVMHRVQVSGPGVSDQLADDEPADGPVASWSHLDGSGTLLAVLPVNGGSARMAIVGYLLPQAPAPTAPLLPANPARPANAGRPANGGRPATAGRPVDAARPVTATHPGRPGPAPSLIPPAPVPLAAGSLVLDTAGRRVLAGGRDAGLVYLEFELLRFLVVNAGRAFTRAQIFRSVWGEEPYESTRTVDIHVHRIRRKLGPEHSGNLVTVRRIGYRYQVPPAG